MLLVYHISLGDCPSSPRTYFVQGDSAFGWPVGPPEFWCKVRTRVGRQAAIDAAVATLLSLRKLGMHKDIAPIIAKMVAASGPSEQWDSFAHSVMFDVDQQIERRWRKTWPSEPRPPLTDVSHVFVHWIRKAQVTRRKLVI